MEVDERIRKLCSQMLLDRQHHLSDLASNLEIDLVNAPDIEEIVSRFGQDLAGVLVARDSMYTSVQVIWAAYMFYDESPDSERVFVIRRNETDATT